MPYATPDTGFIQHQHLAHSVDMDLCNLLQTMSLDYASKTTQPTPHYSTPDIIDDAMSEDLSYQSDSTSGVSPKQQSRTISEEPCGCGYLQVIHSQLEDYGTTSGEYLDAIFTHREIFLSYPALHRGCAKAFADIAYMLEKRAWRADREADAEAVTAFRHESWVIWSSLNPVAKANDSTSNKQPPICVMPMMG